MFVCVMNVLKVCRCVCVCGRVGRGDTNVAELQRLHKTYCRVILYP